MNIIKTNLQFNSNYETRTIESIRRIILHHSGVSVLQTIETIHNYHKNTRHYAGIGYNFYVRKDGSIYEGRPLNFVGGHAYNNNRDSIGICAEGDYDNETMPEAQKQAMKELVAYLKGKYGISKVQRHKDVNSTSCPGSNYPFDEIVNGTVETPVQASSQGYTYDQFVRDVQVAEGQTGKWIDGIAGSKTLNLTPTVSAKINRNHKIVTPLERYLKQLGFYNGEIEADKGKTPIFGSGMTAAVNRYQKEVLHYKRVDGEITAKKNMWKSLLKLI